MPSHDLRDIFGGAALILLGAFVVIYATTQLQVGSLSRMGPGLFPAALGALLCVFGVVIILQALGRPNSLPKPALRQLFFVLASILVFGLTIRRFGIAPAVVLTVLVATRADRSVGWRTALVLAGGLAALAVLIFNVGLDVPIEAFRWWGR